MSKPDPFAVIPREFIKYPVERVTSSFLRASKARKLNDEQRKLLDALRKAQYELFSCGLHLRAAFMSVATQRATGEISTNAEHDRVDAAICTIYILDKAQRSAANEPHKYQR